MTTCEPCEQLELPLMSFAAASPVRTSALPVKAPASTASAAVYGLNTPELLARFDPATSSWRTSQFCLDGALAAFSETWPRSGMTRSGAAYALAISERRISEIASGLLPTPLSSDATGGPRKADWKRGPAPGLKQRVRMGLLPTPSATSYGTNQGGGMGRVGPVRPSLETMARRNLLPTPGFNDYRSGRGYSHGDKSQTPQLRHMIGGLLNPQFVEQMLGFPIGWTALRHSATRSSRRSRS